jgi:hypothetical protein
VRRCPDLEPGEQFQAAFLANAPRDAGQRPLNGGNDRRILLFKPSGRVYSPAKGALAEAPRDIKLGPWGACLIYGVL